MNNKRKLVITGVAVLVFFVGVAAFAAIPSLGKSAQPIPAYGHIHISYYDSQFLQIPSKNQAPANSGVNSKWVPGQENIQGQQGRYISPQEYMQRYFSNQFSK